MTNIELWKTYAARNPSFDGDGQVTMSAAGLRKFFNQTWSIAHDSGYQKAQREAALRSKIDSNINPFFNSMFGGR